MKEIFKTLTLIIVLFVGHQQIAFATEQKINSNKMVKTTQVIHSVSANELAELELLQSTSNVDSIQAGLEIGDVYIDELYIVLIVAILVL